MNTLRINTGIILGFILVSIFGTQLNAQGIGIGPNITPNEKTVLSNATGTVTATSGFVLTTNGVTATFQTASSGGGAVSATTVTASSTVTAPFITSGTSILKIAETGGIQLSDDNYTSTTLHTIIPTANTLTFAVAGSGAVVIDATDSLNMDTIKSTSGGAITIKETSGIIISDDSGTSNLSTTITSITGGSSNGELLIDPSGAGFLTIGSTDTAETNFIRSYNNTNISITGRGTGSVLLNDSTGVILADDSATASTLSTFTPTANTLTLGIAGTGTFVLDSTDKLSTNQITGNGGSLKLYETSGIAFGDDSGTAATLTTFTPGTNTLTLDVAGSGNVIVAAGDSLKTDVILATGGTSIKLEETSGIIFSNDSDTANTRTTFTPGADNITISNGGGSLTLTTGAAASNAVFLSTNDGGSNNIFTYNGAGAGAFVIASGDSLKTNTLQSTGGTTITIAESGGVEFVNDTFNAPTKLVPGIGVASRNTLTFSTVTGTSEFVMGGSTVLRLQDIAPTGSVINLNAASLVLLDNNGTNSSSFAPTASTLTLNVDGSTGNFNLTSGDSMKILGGNLTVTGSTTITNTLSVGNASTATITSGSTSLVVTMAKTQPDATYHVDLTSIDANVGLPSNCRVTSRTTTQFTLTYTIASEDIDITYCVVDF